jgi:hypothetical protein
VKKVAAGLAASLAAGVFVLGACSASDEVLQSPVEVERSEGPGEQSQPFEETSTDDGVTVTATNTTPVVSETGEDSVAADSQYLPVPVATTASVASSVLASGLAAANALPVGAVAPVSPYDRDEYQPGGWPDSDGDCQNDRHEVLIQESLDVVTFDDSGCFVETGRWVDAYDGASYTSAGDVTIDHVIALAHAHRVGASGWDLNSKQAFAADLTFAGSLVVVGQGTNKSKGASSPAEWRPPSPERWCSFGLDWVRGKERWGLAYEDEAEKSAVIELLNTCTNESLRSDQLVQVDRAQVATSTTTTTTSTTIVPEGDPTARLVSCSRRGETVVIANDGAGPLDMRNYRLHDEGDKHSYTFGNLSIEPGGTLTIATGPDAESGENRVVWKNQNVWNNDGDEAFLIDPNGGSISLRCT